MGIFDSLGKKDVPAEVIEHQVAEPTTPVLALAKATTDKPAVWKAKGIGDVAVMLHEFMFDFYDMADMDKEEKKELADTTANYFNKRWPDGAKYEPEIQMLGMLSGLWVPRVAAYRARKKVEADAKQGEKNETTKD